MKVTRTLAVFVALIAIIPAAAILLVNPVKADTLSDRQQQIQDLKDATVERRCEIITNNIDRLTANYESKHETQVEKYKATAQKVKDEMDRLEALGYDVTELRTALQHLNTEIIEFSDLRAQFQADLSATKDLVCGESEGAYKAKVEEARAELKLMRAKAQEISATLKNEVKPAVQHVLQQRQN